MRLLLAAGPICAILGALAVRGLGLGGCGDSHPAVVTEGPVDDSGTAGDDAAVRSAGDAGDSSVGDGSTAASLRVLFIGNSYTSTNDLPGQLAALASTSGVAPAITTSSVITGGATLGDLWDAGAATSAIGAGGFTHVVLQEQSETPVCDPASFTMYAGPFAGAARAKGAVPALYETWARIDGSTDYATYPCLGGTPTAMQDALLAAYENAATDAGATVVKVGEAWRSVIGSYPSIALFQSEGSHPSIAGTYLSACVFYAKLTGQPVPPTAAVPAGIAASDAAHLRDAALQAATK